MKLEKVLWSTLRQWRAGYPLILRNFVLPGDAGRRLAKTDEDALGP